MCVAVALNACGDPTSLSANLSTSVDTLSVFALSGTPPSYPSGVSILARQPVQVNGFGAFDVALDINAAGNAVVYPIRLVVGSGGARPVGLQKATGLFEAVVRLQIPGTTPTTRWCWRPARRSDSIDAQRPAGCLPVCSFPFSVREDWCRQCQSCHANSVHKAGSRPELRVPVVRARYTDQLTRA